MNGTAGLTASASVLCLEATGVAFDSLFDGAAGDRQMAFSVTRGRNQVTQSSGLVFNVRMDRWKLAEDVFEVFEVGALPAAPFTGPSGAILSAKVTVLFEDDEHHAIVFAVKARQADPAAGECWPHGGGVQRDAGQHIAFCDVSQLPQVHGGIAKVVVRARLASKAKSHDSRRPS